MLFRFSGHMNFSELQRKWQWVVRLFGSWRIIIIDGNSVPLFVVCVSVYSREVRTIAEPLHTHTHLSSHTMHVYFLSGSVSVCVREMHYQLRSCNRRWQLWIVSAAEHKYKIHGTHKWCSGQHQFVPYAFSINKCRASIAIFGIRWRRPCQIDVCVYMFVCCYCGRRGNRKIHFDDDHGRVCKHILSES